MTENALLTIPQLFGKIVEKHGECNALAFVGEKAISFRELSVQVNSLINFMHNNGIQKGDKVAILSTNMPNWGAVYLAVTSMGAITVPLLPDFSPTEIDNILNHSETKAIFISHLLVSKIKDFDNDKLSLRINIEDFSFAEKNSGQFEFTEQSELAIDYNVAEDDTAAIIYTSGTTGKSKGVMLSHKNICFNALKSRVVQYVDERDRFLSILPLSHTYENTLGFILPMISGSAVYYLQKPATPAVLLPALLQVKPTMVLSVPLIIEKIYRNKILPTFNDKLPLRLLYKIPFFRRQLNYIAGIKLKKTFGGELKFFGIGGAKLDRTIEKFLIEARFPYAIGYGLTETSPLLAGVNPSKIKLQSTGPAIEGIELKIHKPKMFTGEGEIWAKGPNIMQGYYKEPALTAEVITKDGWLKTGDLGVFDKDNFLFIKGRLKNVIIGASGENIYPEEIESVINNFNFVTESLVVEQKGKLVALVYFNREELEKRYQSLKEEVSAYVDRKVVELKKELEIYVNSRVNKFSRVQVFVDQRDPFKKTATQKIKRFLYTK
jgi:long-chain acyl-CoA synthetase